MGGAEQPVALDLVLPPLRAHDLLQGEAAAEGVLEVRLSDVRLGFDPAFLQRAQGVFGGDVLTAAVGAPGALPDLFYRGREVREASTRLPVRMIVGVRRLAPVADRRRPGPAAGRRRLGLVAHGPAAPLHLAPAGPRGGA